jgi:hypothetical protein
MIVMEYPVYFFWWGGALCIDETSVAMLHSTIYHFGAFKEVKI